ncbi:MAG: YraN family protein [Ardenticatenales bacterium]|nr:YraN family protein [Ardenticatenales bacterium]
MSKERQNLGAWGESVAATYLEAHGYRIVRRNWRCARGEIDIVAQMGETLVFVEVKTRRGRARGTPEEAVTPRKAARLLRLAQAYLLEEDLDLPWRVDVMAVELDGRGKLLRCEHLPGAVLGW